MNFDEFCTIVPLMRAWLHGVLGHGLIRAACDQGEKKGVERFQVRMGKSYLSTPYATICNNFTPHFCKKFPLIHIASCSTGCSSLAQATPSGDGLVIKLPTCQNIGQLGQAIA